jgi:hypothetical protein
MDRCKAVYEWKPEEMVMLAGDLNIDGRRREVDDKRGADNNEKDNASIPDDKDGGRDDDRSVRSYILDSEFIDNSEDSREYILMKKILCGEGIYAKYVSPRFSIAGLRYSSSSPFIVRDLLKESYAGHPVTYSDVVISNDGQSLPRERVLTPKQRQGKQCRFDYLLMLNDRDAVEENVKRTVDVDIYDTKVEEFSIKRKGSAFSQISGKYWKLSL